MRIVVSYRGIPDKPGWATGDHVARALTAMGHEVHRYGTIYHSGCQRIEPNPSWWPRADLLLAMECGDEEPQYTELRDLDCPRVMWDFDTTLHRGPSRKLARHLEPALVCVANRLEMPVFDGVAPVLHIPYAAAEDVFAPPAAPAVRSGVAIIGHAFGPRAAFADEAGVELVSGLYKQDYVSALQRLAVHVHYMASGGHGLVVMRPWETMACGCCLLAERDQELERLGFHDGHEYFAFDGVDDCRAKVAGLLAWRGVACAVGAAGLGMVLGAHTYRHRCETILNSL